MSVRSSLHASLQHKCATCHEGEMFKHPIAELRQPFEMHDRCPVCTANYFPEPGYYYGAMFTSYFLSAFLSLGFVMLTHWVLGWSLVGSFVGLTLLVAVAFVWWFRFSRALWLNLMVRYRPERSPTSTASC
ncbi:MAG: DUF983 domain-containing protein [Lewinella sp.]